VKYRRSTVHLAQIMAVADFGEAATGLRQRHAVYRIGAEHARRNFDIPNDSSSPSWNA
jgi:hypothetical protein